MLISKRVSPKDCSADLGRVATQYPFKNSLTFDHFPDPFGRPILAIFIHRQFENFAQIFMLADSIFKEKSQTINSRKGMFLNIN